jgi:hypothetical protein
VFSEELTPAIINQEEKFCGSENIHARDYNVLQQLKKEFPDKDLAPAAGGLLFQLNQGEGRHAVA